jgi:prohibitin 1
MALLIITSIIFVILFFVLGIDWKEEEFRFRPRQLSAILVFLILGFGLFVRVGKNEVGIIYDPFQGGVQNQTLSEGFQGKSIFAQVTMISTVNRQKEVTVWSQTRDSEAAEFVISLIYKVDPENAGSFFRATGGKEISDRQLDSLITTSLNQATTQFDVYDILGGKFDETRALFESHLRELLFQEYKLNLVKATFIDVDAGPEIEAIIRQKSQAKQQIEIAEQERLRAEVDAATALIRANNAAQVILISAQATAEAQITLNSVTVNAIREMYLGQFKTGEDTATPEVYGYLTIQEVTSTILTQLYYDTWDGKLPTVVAGDGTGLIIQP